MTQGTTHSLTIQVLEALRERNLYTEMHVEPRELVLNPYTSSTRMTLCDIPTIRETTYVGLLLPSRAVNPTLDLQVLEVLGEFHNQRRNEILRADCTGQGPFLDGVHYYISPQKGNFSDDELGEQIPERMIDILQRTPPRSPQKAGYVIFW